MIDLSIHDVMPETLDRVDQQLALINRYATHPVTLLVVPGKPWRAGDLDRLRDWIRRGHRLAGHGWTHRAGSIRGLRHRLHSRLISRDCAEHLALSGRQIQALMQRCRGWFATNKLPLPERYVPPAWALGRIDGPALRATGFELVETLTGFIDLSTGRYHRAALVGFEAVDRWQLPAIRVSNAINRLLARRWPLRIALHPDDHRLGLADDLLRELAQVARHDIWTMPIR